MKKTLMIGSIGLVLMLLFTVSLRAQSIVGVWKLTSEATSGTDAKTRQIKQPSMYFFTKKHYSIIWVTSDDARPLIDAGTSSAEDLRKVFVDSFVANAGAYDLKAGKLSIWPSVAKSPNYMNPGSNATFIVKIKGNTMSLTSETANNYPVKTPTTYTLTRVE